MRLCSNRGEPGEKRRNPHKRTTIARPFKDFQELYRLRRWESADLVRLKVQSRSRRLSRHPTPTARLARQASFRSFVHWQGLRNTEQKLRCISLRRSPAAIVAHKEVSSPSHLQRHSSRLSRRIASHIKLHETLFARATVTARIVPDISQTMGSDSEPDRKKGDVSSPTRGDLEARRDSTSIGAGDDAILPTGVLDPVYDAKARVLNRAVSIICHMEARQS